MKTFLPFAAALMTGGCATLTGSEPRVPLVDYHQHLVSPAFAAIAKLPEADGADLVRRLDAAGIPQALVLSTGYSFADERKKLPDPDDKTRAENDWVSAQVAMSHGRLVGFCSANPLRAAALGELDRCLQLRGMRGIKLHFGNSGVTLRDPAHRDTMRRLFAFANDRRAPILVHFRYRGGIDYGPEDAQLFLDTLVHVAPDIDIVVAHLAGSGPGFDDQSDGVMGGFGDAAERKDPRMKRVYFDVATDISQDSGPDEAAKVAHRIRQLGAARVLYGSDIETPASPTIAENWQLFRNRVPLTPAEFATIARQRLPFMR